MAPNFMSDGVWQQTLGRGFVVVDASYAHGGQVSYAPNGLGGSKATVQQTLSTTPGQSYDLSFYYRYDPNGPITVTFGGKAVDLTYDTDPNQWNLETVTGLVATGTSTVLAFSAIGADTVLDDVDVTPSVVSAAPEPNALMLLTCALSAMGLAAWRRRRALL